ncbi:MAG: indolepyruvate oxidoreductase subunit beta family protein [Burkholderiales bacterium]|nr:indolepyruvate oxidoreductase subunit beta family protein [Burkholderiales bacterium]
MNAHPISLLVCALGGEGGGVLTEWLVEVARHAGHAVQATSIPGVAQRTGATTYYIEVFPVPVAQLAGKRPVFSLSPVPGALDAIVSSELLETARQVSNGMSAPDRTLVVTSSSRALTTHEKMQLGDGRSDSADLLKLVQRFSREHHVFDMAAVAKECGTVVSAVMLGAIAGSGVFPFAREQYEAVVKGEASLRGFARGFDMVGSQAAHPTPTTTTGDSTHPVGWAAPLPTIRDLGYARLIEYQGKAYADLYTQRLQAIPDPDIANETARWLALWMAFDDIVRVADLKSRTSRWQRVRSEVKAGDDDLLKVYDHFKPGVPEFAALLPESLATRLTAWDRRRPQPWALPLKVGSHTVFGMLGLRLLASLKWLRVRGHRYALEQRMIEKWLAGIVEGARRHRSLGLEVAKCGRLIKGYGTTNERGKDNLLHVLDHLARLPDPEHAARAVAAAREAALADDAGQALDATLAQHGAPARPVKAVPIRFIRKTKSAV